MDSKTILWGWMQSVLETPYIWGGDDFKGYDCSGLIQEALAIIGRDPRGDQTAQGLYDHFVKTQPKTEYAMFSDLVFFGYNSDSICHVAMALNSNLMFEAGGGGYRTINEKMAECHNAKVRIRPISNRNDLHAILRLYL